MNLNQTKEVMKVNPPQNAEQASTELFFRLKELWDDQKSLYSVELNHVFNRRFVYTYYRLDQRPKILIMGINPAFRKDETEFDEYGYTYEDNCSKDRYFKKIHDVLPSSMVADYHIVYADLFYLRQTEQARLKDFIDNEAGIQFMIKQLRITMDYIQEINPDMILIFNKGAWNYWGKNYKANATKHKNAWMGFDFAETGLPNLFRISGMLNTEQAIYKNFVLGALNNTPIFFSQYLAYLNKEQKGRITDEIAMAMDTIKIR